MNESKEFKILMCSRPGGDRGPGLTFSHHVDALNEDVYGRFDVDEIWKLHQGSDLNKYDVFWFYAKGFNPSLYNFLKTNFPDKKYVFGPNVLLDKPDIGAADKWDEWFLSQVDFDLYIDQVEFYNNHVKKFLREDLVSKADYLDKCVTFDIDPDLINNKKTEYDCLVYAKKRRYDHNYDIFYSEVTNLLESENISHKIITYGDYKREEYFDELLKAKCCLNLSLDECPGIATYEAMFFNTPIIGSPNNTPSIFDQSFWVHETDQMTEKYLERVPGAASRYVDKVKQFLDGSLKVVTTPRDYILKHAGYERYADDAYSLMVKYCS